MFYCILNDDTRQVLDNYYYDDWGNATTQTEQQQQEEQVVKETRNRGKNDRGFKG